MGFKEELEERRQREEAKRYFRSNNPYYLNTETWIKMLITGLLLAISCGVLYGLFVMLVNIEFSYVLAFMGVIIAKVLKKVAGVGNEKVAITTVFFYFLSILFSHVFSIAFMSFMIVGSFGVIFSPYIWQAAFASLFGGGVMSGIIYVMGAIYAYQYANN